MMDGISVLAHRCGQTFQVLRSLAPGVSASAIPVQPIVQRCRQVLDVLERRRLPRLPPPILLLPGPATPSAEPKRAPRRHRPHLSEDNGEFCFKGDILDHLDRYQTYARRLKRVDPDAYGLYSKLGATIVPPDTLLEKRSGKVSPWFRETLPTFGCVGTSLIREVDEEAVKKNHVNSQFVYFTKYKVPPCEVQRLGQPWPIYKVSIMWDQVEHRRIKRPALAEFAIAVAPDGEVHILHIRHTETQVIRHHDRRGRGFEHSYIERPRWGIPPGLLEWAAEHKKEPREMLRDVFLLCTEYHERGNSSMIRVTAEKNGITAAFAVNVLRTPQFFADREVVVNQNGNKKRIFHIVGVHTRTLRDGRTVGVRMGFRGLRRFRWNGYNIAINVPEKHHPDIAGMDIAIHDGHELTKDYRDLSHLGDVLHAYIYAGHDAALTFLHDNPAEEGGQGRALH